jgi:hypothetical protein
VFLMYSFKQCIFTYFLIKNTIGYFFSDIFKF